MESTNICRSCGCALTDANDSEAHVIPNALGGRLKLRRVLCQVCNTKLDRIADNALVNAFGVWPTLLDLPRDRGSHPPKVTGTRQGRQVRIEPDGTLTDTAVSNHKEPSANGQRVAIAAATMKIFRQLLGRAAKEFPEFDPEQAEQHARIASAPDDDELVVSYDFSPQAVFGGVVTAVWLYGIHATGHALVDGSRLAEVINTTQSQGRKFRYFVDGLPGLRGPDIPIGHKIILRSFPSRGELFAYIEMLRVLRVGGIFATTGGTSDLIEHIYGYDVAGRADRSAEFSIDASEFETQNWRTVGLGTADSDQLRKYFRATIEGTWVPYYRARFSGPP